MAQQRAFWITSCSRPTGPQNCHKLTKDSFGASAISLAENEPTLVCVLGRTRGFDSPAYRNAPTAHDRIVIWHHAQPSTDRRRGWVRGFLNNRGANNEIYILECERAAGLYEKRLFGLLSGAAAGFPMSAGDQDGTGTGGCPIGEGLLEYWNSCGEERVLLEPPCLPPIPPSLWPTVWTRTSTTTRGGSLH